jgi:hypothetical protein
MKDKTSRTYIQISMSLTLKEQNENDYKQTDGYLKLNVFIES